MALTPGLARALEAAALEEAAALKARYVGRIQALLDAVEPALTPLELSVGLGVDTADKTRSVVSRWLSAATRNVRAVPDEAGRALIDRLFAGEAVMAVGPALILPGGAALRQLTFCESWEAPRLGDEWRVVRLSAGSDAIEWSGGAASAVGAPGAASATGATGASASSGGGEGSGGDEAAAVRGSGFDPELPLRAAPRRLLPGGAPITPLGLGAMRLSTASKGPDGAPRRPEPAEAIAVLRRALDLGVRLIDTADSYALDDRDLHHNELLIRRALDGWSHAERDEVIVATKAGLVRPHGRWAPNGRPDHLIKACEGSLRALGVEALPLFQLHVKDPRVPYEESLGALAELYRAGKVRHLGVCNVTPADLGAALRVLPEGSLVAVQNELNPFDTASARGVLAMTKAQGLTLLAHSPLGGHAGVHRVMKKDVLADIALRHGRGAGDTGRHQVVLAWLLTLGPHVIPIFGATRTFSVESSLGALQLELTADDLAAIDRAFPKAAALRDELPPVVAHDVTAVEVVEVDPDLSKPLPPPGLGPEVVMVLGMPGAGKSTLIEPYLDAGYLRLNRDELGGKLDDLVPHLRSAIASGRTQIVLDNTYPTARTRDKVIAAARAEGLAMRCVWLDTTLADARWNASLRMLHRHGRLLAPDEIAVVSKNEPNMIPPLAQQIWLKNFEAPRMAEGFTQIERRAFVRWPRPERTRKGLLLDVDGTLRLTRSGEKYPRDPFDVVLQERRREVLRRWHDDGWELFFVSNQSGVASGRVSRDLVEAAFDKTIELLGLPVVDVAYCPHQAFPVACFCRKPMPGLAVQLIERHHLSLKDLVVVGDMKSDAELAAGIGARYFDAADFFGVDSERAGG